MHKDMHTLTERHKVSKARWRRREERFRKNKSAGLEGGKVDEEEEQEEKETKL